MRKFQTREQAQKTKAKAVRFVHDVLGDDERADELDAEPLESYAQRKRIQIINPVRGGRKSMARKPTRPELEETLDTVYEKLQEAYGPRISREEMAEKIGDVLDELAGDQTGEVRGSKRKGLLKPRSGFFGGTAASRWGSQNPQGSALAAREGSALSPGSAFS